MSKVRADNYSNRQGTGAPDFPDGLSVTGAAATFTGNVTIGGTLTYQDVTNIDSVGIITAQQGIQVLANGLDITGVGTFKSNVSIADKIIHTGDTDTAIRFPAADTFTVETAGSERVRVTSDGKFGVGQTPSMFFEVLSDENDIARFSGPNAGNVVLRNDTSNEVQIHTGTSDALIFGTGGENERMRITSTGGIHFNNAELIERVNITAGKLSDNQNINLDNGMIHHFTTTETTTATPNIMTTTGINTAMATGDAMSVTIVTTAAAAGYAATVHIDGVTVGTNGGTLNWTGGSAPSDGGSSGVDIYAYTIMKTASATYTVIATQTKTS